MTERDLLASFAGCPVLVVGDVMLDEYVWGTARRISPEAPVPVVAVERRTTALGGAGNTATNIAGLGGVPVLVGVAGADAGGQLVRALLDLERIDPAGVIADPTRPTTTKTRILAQGQQVVRVDHECLDPLTARQEGAVEAVLEAHLPRVRGCVVSDYGKNLVSRRLMTFLVAACRGRGIPLVVDPKGAEYEKYRGVTLIKPNQAEAGEILHRPVRSQVDVERAGRELNDRLGGHTTVLITQGAQGMTLFPPAGASSHYPALAREVFDVTGAGDTVAAVLGLSLAEGAGCEVACRLANRAASVVVGKVGTARVRAAELFERVPDRNTP